MQTDLQNIITRYLLGELPETEMSDLEARYFAEPEFFDQVLKVESGLVDEYSRDHMSADLLKRFEAGYMADLTRRDRVRFAEALATRLDGKQRIEPSASFWQSLTAFLGGQQPALRFGMAMGLILIAVSVLWLFNRKTKTEVAQIPPANVAVGPTPQKTEPINSQPIVVPTAPSPTPSNNAVQPKPSPTPEIEKPPRSVSLALVTGGVRGGDSGRIQTLTIPRGTSEARLSVRLPENAYSSYRLLLKTLSGNEVATRALPKPNQSRSSLVLTVPAANLADGDYILTLTGIGVDKTTDDLSKSLFRVKRQN